MNKTHINISIITPLYHGEEYIDRLLRLIYYNYYSYNYNTQGNVQYILVNDSPDNKIDAAGHIRKLNHFINACDAKYSNGCYGRIQQSDDSNRKYIDCLNRLYKSTSTDVAEYGNSRGFSVLFINNECNCGIHSSRVNGIKHATGDYILFLDQDDAISKDALIKLSGAVTDRDNPADMVIGNGVRRWTTDNSAGRSYRYKSLYKRKLALWAAKKEWIYIYGTDMIFSPGQCLVKKSAIPQYWMDNILKTNGCDDCYLWLLMLDNGCSIKTINSVIYCHVESENNYSNSYNAMNKSFMNMCELLAADGSYSNNKTSVLRRRYKLKTDIKTTKSTLKKFMHALKNPDIIIATFFYKLCGYH